MLSFAFLGFPSLSFAEVKFSGDVKNLYTRSRSILDDKPYGQDLTRATVVMDVKNGWFTGQLNYRHEVRYGDYSETRDYRLFGLGRSPLYLHWEDAVESGKRWRRDHGVYRGWVGLEVDRTALRFGRQRIAWGTGKLWNPTDVLNPHQPVNVEREERRGTDAAYLRQSLGELAQFEAVYAPWDTRKDTQALGRLRLHAGRTDFSVMGGKAAGDDGSWTAGGDFASDLGGGSLHGEAAWTDPVIRDPYFKGLLGYEYRLEAGQSIGWLDDLWLLGEYYRNGAGETDKARYNFVSVLSGGEVSLARDYLGLGLTKELTPLWTLEAYAIRNLNDGSLFAGPSLKWNALTDLDIMAGAQLFGGSSSSEYGRLHSIQYLQAQFFFGS